MIVLKCYDASEPLIIVFFSIGEVKFWLAHIQANCFYEVQIEIVSNYTLSFYKEICYNEDQG